MSCYSGQYDIKLGLSSAKSHEKNNLGHRCARDLVKVHISFTDHAAENTVKTSVQCRHSEAVEMWEH